jgi:hypothetical protein
MASPSGATMVRLKIAPQRGHAVALTEIMAPHAGHDVILVMALPHASPFVRSLSRAADLHQYNKRHFRHFAIRASTVPPGRKRASYGCR